MSLEGKLRAILERHVLGSDEVLDRIVMEITAEISAQFRTVLEDAREGMR